MLLFASALLPVLASVPVDEPAFPLVLMRDSAGFVEFVPDEDALATLRERQSLVLRDVPMPLSSPVDLVLERTPLPEATGNLWVDGVPEGATSDLELSMWSGSVRQDPESEVWLTFSPHGSWGWIRTHGSLVHLISSAGS